MNTDMNISGLDDNAAYYSELYSATYRRMYGYAVRSARHIADIDDILQNAYIACWRRIKTGFRPANPESYVFTAVKNSIRSYYRLKRHENAELAFTDDPDGAPNELAALLAEDISDTVADKITADGIWRELFSGDGLTARIFLLYFRQNCTIAETAKCLGVSESTVKNRMYRTLKSLADKYRKQT